MQGDHGGTEESEDGSGVGIVANPLAPDAGPQATVPETAVPEAECGTQQASGRIGAEECRGCEHGSLFPLQYNAGATECAGSQG